jgi:uncharacterized membrane protein
MGELEPHWSLRVTKGGLEDEEDEEEEEGKKQ